MDLLTAAILFAYCCNDAFRHVNTKMTHTLPHAAKRSCRREYVAIKVWEELDQGKSGLKKRRCLFFLLMTVLS